MAKELHQIIQSGNTPPACQMVEAVLSAQISGVLHRTESLEGRMEGVERGLDGKVTDLWEDIRKGQESVREALVDHGTEDLKALQVIREELLTRVPPWVLAIMTVGGSAIGAMAMYILEHIKPK